MTKAKLQEFEGSVISIILPTRGRTGGALQDSIKSLLENADDPSRIEIMLGVDDDDKESIDWVNNEAADFVSPFGCACKRLDLGYEQLNIYVNLLSMQVQVLGYFYGTMMHLCKQKAGIQLWKL